MQISIPLTCLFISIYAMIVTIACCWIPVSFKYQDFLSSSGKVAFKPFSFPSIYLTNAYFILLGPEAENRKFETYAFYSSHICNCSSVRCFYDSIASIASNPTSNISRLVQESLHTHNDVGVVLAISGILVSSYPLFVIKTCQKFDSSFEITEAWETHL